IGVASGDHVNRRVTDDHRLVRAGTCLLKQCMYPERIWFLRVKAVSAVNADEELAQSQRVDYGSLGNNRLIRQHRHAPLGTALPIANGFQGFLYTVVRMSIIQLVDPIIGEKVLQRLL